MSQPVGANEMLMNEGNPRKCDVCMESHAQRSMWHYSRFEWQSDLSEKWCETFLFYSSADLTGPFSLYPLFKDPSMSSHPPHRRPSSSAARTFCPRFVRLDLCMHRCRSLNIHVLVFADILKSIKVVLRHPEYTTFQRFLQLHGLTVPDLRLLGFEKVMIYFLHFMPAMSTPIGGFWYTHTFEDVVEPNTLCLTAFAANAIANPVLDTVEGHLFEKFCAAAEQRKPVANLQQLDEVSARQLQALAIIKCSSAVGREIFNTSLLDYISQRLKADQPSSKMEPEFEFLLASASKRQAP
eukprot:GGOE01056885.1.p1 GENE.GGOE01056885.1~~GGOE01056885.1.p1  ORF type:complete len:326 (-),score=49.20 GGOE01056885.1:112-999(-)